MSTKAEYDGSDVGGTFTFKNDTILKEKRRNIEVCYSWEEADVLMLPSFHLNTSCARNVKT